MNRPVSTALARLVLDVVQPRLDGGVAASTRPFTGEPAPLPYADDRTWAWTHFGVFVPLLPEPYRYVNTMTLVGATGTEMFDNDELADGDARRLSTVLASTAHGCQHHYRGYGPEQYSFAADGSRLRWADDLAIDVGLPEVVVRGRYDAFEVDLALQVTDQVSYFVKTPIYQHYSVLAPYTGVLRDEAGETEIAGLGTFEYARSRGHQSLFRRALPERWKLPADFFTYQIIQLDDRTQILLTEVQARGRTACRTVHIRTLGGTAEVVTDVTFEVLGYGEPVPDAWGRPMRVPAEFRWRASAPDGSPLLDLVGSVDSPLRHGHGRGCAGAYSYSGTFRGAPVDGSAYLEWIDVRPGR